MTTKPLIFSDLDDTLFQTERKMAGMPPKSFLASISSNGSDSYMTHAQKVAFDWLAGSARLIPVTARSTQALENCRLSFTDYRIVSNGAVVMAPDGLPDQDWLTRTSGISKAWSGQMLQLEARVEAHDPGGLLRHWIVQEFGMPVYLCVKSNGSEARLDAIQEILSDVLQQDGSLPFLMHRNGNNLSFTPDPISKKAAVEYLIGKLDPEGLIPVWGMGDSLTDIPFMSACQMMVMPMGSQVQKALPQKEFQGKQDV